MFYQLPPAGNPITLKKSEGSIHELGDILQSPKIQLYGSGTSALAAAIKAAMVSKGKSKAEVLLPAYTCPELVSAILFAGADPVLVDLEEKRPWLSLADLEKKITDKTVAIIAVNLFGISERFDKIRAVIRSREIVLIEDSAQYFPTSASEIHWRGDLTVLSFGRGKPVSLLGGGAVIASNSSLYKDLAPVHSLQKKLAFGADALFQLKAVAYNLLLSPRLYWLPQSLPFLHLGETMYHPLISIEAFPSERLAYLPSNIRNYWRWQKQSNVKAEAIPELISNQLIDLPAMCCGTTFSPLIRYPFLAATKEKADRIYSNSKYYGLGVSRMYQKPLNEIEGLRNLFISQGPFPNSKEFADLLLTFPTHSGVPENYMARTGERLFSDAGS